MALYRAAPVASQLLISLPKRTFSCSVYRGFKMPFAIVSSISPPNSRKVSNRKNYLRQKLLKTLPIPSPSSLIFELSPENPLIHYEDPPEENSSFPSDHVCAGSRVEVEELEVHEVGESQVAEPVKTVDNSVGKFSKDSVFKFGLWLVGAFVFQTVCAVWVLGSAEIVDKNGNDSINEDNGGFLEVGMNGKSKSKLKLFVNTKMGIGNYPYLDEEKIEKKIEEIRVMAREAREMERLKMRRNGSETKDNDKGVEKEDFGKSGIEKEVNDQLTKLRKRLENVEEKLPVALIDNVKKHGDCKDGQKKKDLNGKEGNAAHMFKKKYKFRGSLSEQTEKPKGFMHSDNCGVGDKVIKGGGIGQLINGGIGSDGIDMPNDERELELAGGDSGADISMGLEEDVEKKQMLEATKSSSIMGKKLVKERNRRKQGKRVDHKESHSNGFTQDREQGRSAIELVMSRKSNVLETTAVSSEHNLLDGNDDLKSREIENPLGAEIELKKSKSETSFWWLSLPYVLVILMRRGLDGGGPQGLFTLRSGSHVKSNLSHTVAFEDRGDATNFCYLLQSSFEDLGDFSAEIVPLTTKELDEAVKSDFMKELDEAVKSDFMKVIVVKKGQLKLYAGQPLPDVEIALRSLVGQS